MTAHDAHDTLQELRAERDALLACALAADGCGHLHDDDIDELLEEFEEMIRQAHDAWVGAAVTEIATLRAQLSGPQLG